MLVAGVLGFQSLRLVVCLVVPAIALFARRKWRLAMARKEEIKRLLILAAEESARAELEAAAEYGYAATAAATVVGPNQCAVCYFPTTTRCARCKAVRYCSGKCQIIHWRQGHKDECCPPSPDQDFSDTDQKVCKEDRSEDYCDHFEVIGQAKPVESFPSVPAYPTHGCSIEVPCEKDGGGALESPTVERETNSASESCSTSFSGFSTSTASSESSDDVSVSDSISSVETEGSDENISADIAFDDCNTTLDVEDLEDSEPLSPKFASLVSVATDEFKEAKSCCVDGDDQCQSLSRNSSVHEGLIAEPFASSSSFWDSALDSIDPEIGSHDDDGTSDSVEPGNIKVSDGSFLSSSFNVSRNNSPVLCMEGSTKKAAIFKDALPDKLDSKKPANGSSLSGNINSASQKRDFQTLNAETIKKRDDTERRSISLDSNPSEVKSLQLGPSSTDSLNVSLPSTNSKNSDHIVIEHNKTSYLLKLRERGGLISSIPNLSSTSSKNSSTASSKAGDIDAAHDGATVSSQVSNSPNVKNGLKTSVQKVVEQFRGSKLPKQYPLSTGSEIAGRYSDKGLFPYESFVKLYTWNKLELQPCGLVNCGNSCYANAVLQCLAFTPPLTAYFLQGLHSKDCVKKDWCFTCEFERLILKAKEGKSPLSPIAIVSQLPNIGSRLGNGREEDAHECLRYVIDTMQSVCLAEAGIRASSSLEEETTLVGLTFGGYLRSKIKCMKCQGKSERHERMMDVTVEIGGDIGSLEEALRKFTSTETLDGENKYQCSRCKSYEKAKKKLTILEAPNVLTIALKRFQSGKFGKLNKPIQFPEILNMAPFMSGTSDKLAIYRLYGVIVHLDVMNAAFSGHYVCYIKNAQNKWFKVDDSTVTPVDLDKVLSKGAYMLLYARCSPRAPRLLRNTLVSSDPKVRSTSSWIGGKTSMFKPKSTTSGSSQLVPGSNHPEGSSTYDSFYSRFHRLQRILEEDSSSDNSSLISNNSEEGSCSTDSTRDSTCTEDFSDYIFGDSVRGWSSPWPNSSDSDTSSSSSSSPLYSKNSPLSSVARLQSDPADAATKDGGRKRANLEPQGTHFLPSDSTDQCRNLASNFSRSSSSSSKSKTDVERLGSDSLNNVKYDASLRRSTRERTVNI